MTNCDICPIRSECDEAREEIVSRHVADMHPFVWGAVAFCPLVELMTEKYESVVKEMFKGLE